MRAGGRGGGLHSLAVPVQKEGEGCVPARLVSLRARQQHGKLGMHN